MVDTVLVAISYDRAGIDARTLSAFHDVVSTGLAFDGWLRQQRVSVRRNVTDSLATVKLFYSLLAAGDSSAALQLLAPDIEWTEAERTPYFVGTMTGPDAVIAGLFAPLARDFDDFTTAPSDFVTERDRVVSFGRYKGVRKSSGRLMSAPFVHLWTVSNGRLRRFVQFTDSAAWNEAI